MAQSRELLRTLFVCRGSVNDGLGHVMRSRTVAQQMARLASVQMVVLGDSYVDSLLAGRGLDYHLLPRDGDILSVADMYDPHVVVFDLIDLDEPTFQAVQERAMTASLSPIFDMLGRVDIIFHRTAHQGSDWNLAAGSAKLRCGLEYAVVRPECVPISDKVFKRNLSEQPLSVMISMGGADARNNTLRVLEALRNVPNRMLFWVLLGEGYGHSYQTLVECIQSDARHEVILAKTNDSMWRIMNMCSLAILAGGTVTYEAAYAGMPSINIFDAAEHMFLLRELVEVGACYNAGYPFADALSVLRAHVAHLEQHRHELWQMHRRSKGMIDGQGAARICNELVEFYWADYVNSANRALAAG